MSEHRDFEELVAGHAFYALEPADEQLLTAHMASCATCLSLIIEAGSVTTALAYAVAAAAPSAGLRERILQAASREPRPVLPYPLADPWPTLISLRESRKGVTRRSPKRRPRITVPGARRLRVPGRLLVGAAAAMVAISVAIPTTLAFSGSGTGRAGDEVLAQRLLEPGSREITLVSTRNPFRAKAVLTPTGAVMIADDLPANAAQDSTYVLWAANQSGMRTAIATFDVAGGKVLQVASAPLPFKVDQITQIAVSVEPGRRAPSAPSDIVLSGSGG